MSVIKRVTFFVGLPLLIVALWWVLTLDNTNFFVPNPSALVQTFGQVWLGDRFFSDFLPSIGRLFTGLIVTIVLGVVLGVLIGSFRTFRNLTEPLFEFFRAIPPPVLVPLFMLLIGINDQMKVAVIVSGAIWPVLLNTVEGVRAVEIILSETCRVYRITGFERLRSLVLPGASPQIMTGIRQCLSLGLIMMIVSEMFGSSSGLGFTIVLFQQQFQIPEMWSGIVLLGIIGVGLSMLSQVIERRVLWWYKGLKEVTRVS